MEPDCQDVILNTWLDVGYDPFFNFQDIRLFSLLIDWPSYVTLPLLREASSRSLGHGFFWTPERLLLQWTTLSSTPQSNHAYMPTACPSPHRLTIHTEWLGDQSFGCPESRRATNPIADRARRCLKLVRNPLNVSLRGFSKYLSLSLYAPITSDECHVWFHLNAASPAARNTEQVNI